MNDNTSTTCATARHVAASGIERPVQKFHFKDFNRLYREAQARRKAAGKYIEPTRKFGRK